METPKIYAGLLGPGIEIFQSDDGLKIIQDGRIKPFSAAPYSVIARLLEQIAKEPETFEILKKWHPDSEMKQVEQFASCRFGGLDFTPDIKNNKLQDGEYHPCPKRGTCEAEGILCKMPKINHTRLSLQMVKLMRLISGTDTNEVISEKMEIPLGSYHLLKKKLYELLNVQTKQEVALISRDLTIV